MGERHVYILRGTGVSNEVEWFGGGGEQVRVMRLIAEKWQEGRAEQNMTEHKTEPRVDVYNVICNL